MAERAPAVGRRLTAYVARLTWAPTLAWAVAVAILAISGIFHLGGNSEFLYWQFYQRAPNATTAPEGPRRRQLLICFLERLTAGDE